MPNLKPLAVPTERRILQAYCATGTSISTKSFKAVSSGIVSPCRRMPSRWYVGPASLVFEDGGGAEQRLSPVPHVERIPVPLLRIERVVRPAIELGNRERPLLGVPIVKREIAGHPGHGGGLVVTGCEFPSMLSGRRARLKGGTPHRCVLRESW